jgi:hypothetical protein
MEDIMTIKKVGKEYELVSKKGKVLGKGTKKEMMHREKQVVFFKNDAQYMKDHGTHIPMKKRGR